MNQLLQANHYFQLNELDAANKLYMSLNEGDVHALGLINSAVIDHQQGKYNEALIKLKTSLSLDLDPLFIVKIYVTYTLKQANLSIISAAISDFTKCKEYSDQAIACIQAADPYRKSDLFRALMKAYFGYETFDQMKCPDPKEEDRLKGMELGFYCNRQAMNREYLMDFQIAFRYHKKALEIWKSLNQQGYMIMCLRRLIGIASTLKSDQKSFQSLLKQQVEQLNLPEEVTIDVFFKDYDKKVACFRNVAASLRRLESSIPKSFNEEHSLHLTAIKFRLTRAKVYALNNGQLLAVDQLTRSISALDKQTIINREFAKDSIKQLDLLFKTFIAKIKKVAIRPFLLQIKAKPRPQTPIPKKSIEPLSPELYQLDQHVPSQTLDLDFPAQLEKPINQIEKQVTQDDFEESSRITFKPKDSIIHQTQIREHQYSMRPKLEVNLEEYKFVNSKKAEYSPIYQKPSQLAYSSNRAAFQGKAPIQITPKSEQLQSEQSNQSAFRQQQNRNIGDPNSIIPQIKNTPKSEIIQQNSSKDLAIHNFQPFQPNNTLSITRPQNFVMSLNSNSQSLPTKPSTSYIKSAINNPRKIINSEQLLRNAQQTCILGDYLTKYNLNSTNKRYRFYQVSQGKLKWADKDSQINDPEKMESYPLCDVRGILFGKCTDALMRHKSLQPWRCLSVMTQNRSMDLYFEENQINAWVILLSSEINKHNPNAKVPRYSKVLWLKLKFRLIAGINNKKTTKLSFVKLLCMYRKNL